VSNKRVKLYTDSLCPICEVVEKFLSEKGIEYTKINIDDTHMTLFSPDTNLQEWFVCGSDRCEQLKLTFYR
jgi:arsenate reductase-like glutaredoxin family protein